MSERLLSGKSRVPPGYSDGDERSGSTSDDIAAVLKWIQPLLAVLTLIAFGAWAFQLGLNPGSVTYSYPLPPPSPPGPPPSPPPPRPPTVPGSSVVDRLVFRLLYAPESRARQLRDMDIPKLEYALSVALSLSEEYISVTEETSGVLVVHVLIDNESDAAGVTSSINNPSFLAVVQYYAGARYVFEHGSPDITRERYATPAPPLQSPPVRPPSSPPGEPPPTPPCPPPSPSTPPHSPPSTPPLAPPPTAPSPSPAPLPPPPSHPPPSPPPPSSPPPSPSPGPPPPPSPPPSPPSPSPPPPSPPPSPAPPPLLCVPFEDASPGWIYCQEATAETVLTTDVSVRECEELCLADPTCVYFQSWAAGARFCWNLQVCTQATMTLNPDSVRGVAGQCR